MNVTVSYDRVPDEKMRDTVLNEIKNSVKESGRVITTAESVASITVGMRQEEDRIHLLE